MIEELKSLQSDFAFIDMLGGESSVLLEIKLMKLSHMIFRMEPDKNHKMPHLHIDYGKERHTASYAVQTGTRIVGDLPNKYDKQVQTWIVKNQVVLQKIWDELQSGDQKKYELSIGQLLS